MFRHLLDVDFSQKQSLWMIQKLGSDCATTIVDIDDDIEKHYQLDDRRRISADDENNLHRLTMKFDADDVHRHRRTTFCILGRYEISLRPNS